MNLGSLFEKVSFVFLSVFTCFFSVPSLSHLAFYRQCRKDLVLLSNPAERRVLLMKIQISGIVVSAVNY